MIWRYGLPGGRVRRGRRMWCRRLVRRCVSYRWQRFRCSRRPPWFLWCWRLGLRSRIAGVRLSLGVEPVAHLDVVWALARWVGAGGGDFLLGGLVAADVWVVFAAIERVHRNEAAVVESGDVFVDFGVEASTLRWRLQRRGSSGCRRVFCCERAIFGVFGASIGPRVRLVGVGFSHRIRACPPRRL